MSKPKRELNPKVKNGDRVMCLHMDGETSIPPMTLGTVRSVVRDPFEDDGEIINVAWDNGSALGLLVLKTILDKDRSKYNEFKALKLIKDWDFTVNMTEVQKEQFITEAQRLGIENQGETLAILRFNKGLLLGEDYLLELSIKTSQELYDLELPLTNLKFLVNSVNIELFFQIVKMYVKKQEDLNIMSRNLNILLTTIQVNGIEQVDSIQNGLYTIRDPVKLSTAGLDPQLLEIMDQIPFQSNDLINPLTMKQFLITQLCEPDRLFLRFLGKNIIKSQKITRFFQANDIRLPYWLINESILDEINRKGYSRGKFTCKRSPTIKLTKTIRKK